MSEIEELRLERDEMNTAALLAAGVISALKAKCDRLTDELYCGNALYAELTDRQNDTAALLDSANQTIHRLRGKLEKQRVEGVSIQARQAEEGLRLLTELKSEQDDNEVLKQSLQTSEAARQEAVAALEADASDLWDVTNAIKKEIAERSWITEGRGAYAHDDDRYRQETRAAFDAIEKLIANVQHPAQKRFHAALGKGETIVYRLAQAEAALDRIAYEPMGAAEASYRDVYSAIVDIARAALSGEEKS